MRLRRGEARVQSPRAARGSSDHTSHADESRPSRIGSRRKAADRTRMQRLQTLLSAPSCARSKHPAERARTHSEAAAWCSRRRGTPAGAIRIFWACSAHRGALTNVSDPPGADVITDCSTHRAATWWAHRSSRCVPGVAYRHRRPYGNILCSESDGGRQWAACERLQCTAIAHMGRKMNHLRCPTDSYRTDPFLDLNCRAMRCKGPHSIPIQGPYRSRVAVTGT